MKFPKIKKKTKYEKSCYHCKYRFDCGMKFKIGKDYCDKFKFCATCKSS